jgi:predicted signal transduction protein with EAL and GGDEF domain
LYLTASVGVSHANTVGEVDLAQGADDAMSVAKEQGGNHAVSFTGSMHQERRKQAKLQEALRRALACEGELTLAYQQVVSVADSPVVAVEVLARWTHPSLGDISPGIFIPLAEERGLIARLGRKLMELAVRDAADRRLRWPDGGAGDEPEHVAGAVRRR